MTPLYNNSGSVGQVAIIQVSTDNLTTTDGNTNDHQSVVDDAGNTYRKIREFTNGNAAAAAGATVSLWYCILAFSVTSGNTITITFSGSITAKTVGGVLFNVAVDSTLEVVTNATDLANDAADPGSMAISGLTSREYLFIRATALERADAGTWTVTGSHISFPTSLTGTTGGAAATNISPGGEYRILTGTGDTSDPTGTAVDCASIFVALREVPRATPRDPQVEPLPFIPRGRAM
jgi:hypothetical protein